MANRWTEQQKQAIAARGSDLLVSAAAGSGKTAVLVERIITRIIEEKQDIDRLLVVTFTKAAASEMSQRIGAAISERLEKEPDNQHLQDQIAFLPRADIKTIHAFCLQVIQEYYHILAIDPATRTADPAEITLLQREVLDDLMEELYADEGNEWFFHLLETFSPDADDSRLREFILAAHTFAQSNPDPDTLLDNIAAQYALAEDETVDDCIWFPLIRDGVSNGLEFALSLMRRAEQLANTSGFEGYLERLTAEREGIEAMLASLSGEYKSWYLAYAAIDFGRLPSYRGADKETAEKIKGLRNETKKALDKLRESYFRYSAETQAQLLRRLAPTVQGFVRLTKLFAARFADAKKEKLMMDFQDYEHFCLKILTAEGSTPERVIPTAAAEELRERYDEIMIDEYQDSNLVQEMILSAVSGESIGKNNRFMVGDVKQSIYRFRQAMPELFQQKYEAYPTEKGGRTRKIILSQNFRSRKNILDGVNFLFRQIMQKGFGDIAYDADAALYAGASFPPCENGFCGGENEILLLETKEPEDSELPEELSELNRRQLEALAIAEKIRKLMESDFRVLDKKTGEYRPLAYGDIAILLRSIKNWGSVLDDVFGSAGIPYYAEASEGYFDMPEVETILQFLQILDNPRQDIPLLAVLHSSVYELTAEELVQIRLEGGSSGLYFDCVTGYLQNGGDEELRGRLAAFLGDLEHWRLAARDLSLPELLRRLYRETGYYDYLSVTAGGALRQANLRLLLEKAEQYEKGSRKGLFYFIRYVADMKTAEAAASSAKLQSEGADLVRVMTIHKSKGLEFPVVFVSDLGKKFNDMDARNLAIFHQKWGIGMDCVNPERRTVSYTLSKRALAEAVRQENRAEETRVLYVALTRAKEKLILTGAVKNLQKDLEKWAESGDCKTEQLPIFRLRKGSSYLDWIMPAFLRHPQAAALPEEWEINRGEPYRFLDEPSQWSLSLMTREDVLAVPMQEKETAAEQRDFFRNWENTEEMTAQKEALFRILGWQYPHGTAVRLPSKISISEIKRKFQEEMTGEAVPAVHTMELPQHKEKAALTPAQIGTAMHIFMEEADLRRAYDLPEIERLAAELVERGRLTAEEAAALRKKELLDFFESDLAEHLRAAKQIEKERPFAILMRPRELFFGPEYADSEEKILVNGIIDCYFTEGESDSIILVDYKSDRIYKEETLRERYAIQLQLYRTALERATGLPVKETYLYSFALGRAIAL